MFTSNELTAWIVDQTFDNPAGLEKKLTAVFMFQTPGTTASLLLVLALVGIVLTLVLWFELLLANAAVAVLIGTSPIAAAGQVSEATKSWWPKLVSATAQLIILKPVIALVFAVGFAIAGDAKADPADVGTLLAGMLILLLAALAWPAIARFFTFASVSVGGGSGLAGVLGFAAGRTNGAGSGGPSGPEPEEFGQGAEARTMSAFGARAGGGGSDAAGAAAGGAMPLLAAGLGLAQRAANSLVGRMEQTAGNAGMDRHNPHPAVAGYPGYQSSSWSTRQNSSSAGAGIEAGGQDSGGHTGEGHPFDGGSPDQGSPPAGPVARPVIPTESSYSPAASFPAEGRSGPEPSEPAPPPAGTPGGMGSSSGASGSAPAQDAPANQPSSSSGSSGTSGSTGWPGPAAPVSASALPPAPAAAPGPATAAAPAAAPASSPAPVSGSAPTPGPIPGPIPGPAFSTQNGSDGGSTGRTSTTRTESGGL